MGVFNYQALDPRQQASSGTISADTPAMARQSLRDRGLTITNLSEAKAGESVPFAKLFRRSGSAEQLAELWRNLAVLLDAGVPLANALEVCLRQQVGGIQVLVRQLHESVQSGQSFADAVARHRTWVDDLTIAIIRVGEHSGTLATSLAELADFQSRRQAVSSKLKTAFIYPAILSVVGIAVVIFLMTFVVPQLVEVLVSADRPLPTPTRILQWISNLLLQHGLLLGVGVAATVIGVLFAARTDRGQRLFERLQLGIPVFGELVRKSWISRIGLMLATMLRTDVRFNDAVRLIREGLPHKLYADELRKIEAAIEAGSDIAGSLRGSRLMPPLVVQLLAVGQESGELPKMLEQVRRSYEKEVEIALSRFIAVLEPALILLLAIVIGFVVFATVLPILETTRMVT